MKGKETLQTGKGKKMFEKIWKRMENEGIEYFGEEGFGDEFVEELKRLGVTEDDDVEIFDEWDDFEGAGSVNGRRFGAEGNNNELRLYWVDEMYGND